MSEDIKVFLAMIATCPAIALVIVGLAASEGHTIENLREGFWVWTFLSGALILLISAAYGLYAVWAWAV